MPARPQDPHVHAPIEEHQPHPDVEAFGGLPGRRGVLTGAAALAAAGLAAPAYAGDDDPTTSTTASAAGSRAGST